MFTINSLFQLETYLNLFRSFLHVTLLKTTLAFLVVGITLTIIAIPLGPKGLIPLIVGVAFVFLGYVHRWRKPRHFAILAVVSLLMFPIGVILHNAFYGLGMLYGHIFILHWLFEFLHVLFFLVAIPASPTGILIGIVGICIILIKGGQKND